MEKFKYPIRICFCGKEFQPETYNQKFCCARHQRINTLAHRSKKGIALIQNCPKAALQWYSFVR